MPKKQERITMTEYARRRGITLEAVRQAIKSGRIVEGHGKDRKGKPYIIAEIADREWAANTDPSKGRPNGGPATGEASDASAPAPAKSSPVVFTGKGTRGRGRPSNVARLDAATPGGIEAIEILELGEANKRQATYKAEILRLELETKRGRLVPIDDVRATVAAEYTAVRQRMLGLPAKLCHELALADDPAACRAIVMAAIDEALVELTADTAEAYDTSEEEGNE